MSKVTQARKARTRPKSRSGMSGMYYLRRARKFHAELIRAGVEKKRTGHLILPPGVTEERGYDEKGLVYIRYIRRYQCRK